MLVIAAAVTATVPAVLTPVSARSADGPDADMEGAAAAEGVTQTLTGPGYCPGRATPVPGSRGVRALAVDDDGQLFYETGPDDDRSVIATLQPQATTEQRPGQSRGPDLSTWPSGVPAPPVPNGAPQATQQTPAGAGRLVADDDRGVIVAAGTRLVHLTPDGVTTLAGDPTGELGGVGPQRAGDHGPATEAAFRSATSLARDAAGNLYVADHGGPALASATVRFINRTSDPVTFYADTSEEIRVEPGHIATIAGAPTPVDDNQQEADSAQAATFLGNTTLAVDDNRLYIASALDETSSQAAVALVNLGGEELTAHGHTVQPGGIQTVAGGGDDPAGTINAAGAIAVAGEDLYITDPGQHRIRHVDSEGFMATFAGAEGLGATVGGFNGNRRPAVGARLDHPFDVAVGPEGQVYVTDQHNGQVRVVDDSGRIGGVPGAGLGLTWQCHAAEDDVGQPVPPRSGGPTSVAVDADGAIYFALAEANLVKRRGPDGRLTVVAGDTGEACQLGCSGFAGDGGPADEARLDGPTAVAVGPKGGVYVYDGGNARVRYVNRTDQRVTVHGVTIAAEAIDTVAGSDTSGARGDGPARDAELAKVAAPDLAAEGQKAAAGLGFMLVQSNFGDLTVDSAGNLFIAEPRQHPDGGPVPPGPAEDLESVDAQVRKVDPHGELTIVAGDGAPGPASRCCRAPAGLALDLDGNLLIADAATYQVWLLNRADQPTQAYGHTIASGQVAAVAGTGDPGFAGARGDGADSELLPPAGLTVDQDGTLYLAQLGILQGNDPGHYVHTLTPEGELELLAGNGQPGFNGDALDPRLTRFNLPTDLALDACGNILVADAGNDRVRRLNLTTPCNLTAAGSTQPAATSWPSTTAVSLLAAVIAAATAATGWYWRRHHHPARPSPDEH